jgi:alcohol dehydrogenase (NADP+)
MEKISKIDKKCRLIKGQVFLWKDNQCWEDLWDVNGEITPA